MESFSKSETKTVLFKEIFELLKNHRRVNKGNIKHTLNETLFLTVSACVSDYNTWESVAEFGKLKIDWLKVSLGSCRVTNMSLASCQV